MEKYKFQLFCLDGNIEEKGFHCFFMNPVEGVARNVFDILQKKLGKFESIYLVGGLMDNIWVKNQTGLQEWSDKISQFVSFDNKEISLSDQIFYFAVENDELLPSNQLD